MTTVYKGRDPLGNTLAVFPYKSGSRLTLSIGDGASVLRVHLSPADYNQLDAGVRTLPGFAHPALPSSELRAAAQRVCDATAHLAGRKTLDDMTEAGFPVTVDAIKRLRSVLDSESTPSHTPPDCWFCNGCGHLMPIGAPCGNCGKLAGASKAPSLRARLRALLSKAVDRAETDPSTARNEQVRTFAQALAALGPAERRAAGVCPSRRARAVAYGSPNAWSFYDCDSCHVTRGTPCR